MSKSIEIQCGGPNRIIVARSPGSALRKLLRVGDGDSVAVLARFREVKVVGKRTHPLTPWLYQDPAALEKEWGCPPLRRRRQHDHDRPRDPGTKHGETVSRE